MDNLIAKQIMHRDVQTVDSALSLPELEQKFFDLGVSGFPVVEDGRLVGVVSRSDIVRQLCWERDVAHKTSDYYRDESGFHEIPLNSWEKIADRIGERLERLHVRDVMVSKIHQVPPDQPLCIVAQSLVDNGIHRILVTEQGKLIGIITSLDIVRLHTDAPQLSKPAPRWYGYALALLLGAFIFGVLILVLFALSG